MKKTIITTLLLTAFVSAVYADNSNDKIKVDGFRAERNGNYLAVDMNIGLAELDVESNRAVLLTPRLVNGDNSLTLPSVAVYGRSRYYYYKRNYADTMLSGGDEMTIRAKGRPDEVA